MAFWVEKIEFSWFPQHGSALDLLWGGESQLPQAPALFKAPFFKWITIE